MGWTDVAMVILTAGSLLVAGLALNSSHRANTNAATAVAKAGEANTIAKTANQVAEEGNAIAKGAADDARAAATDVAWDELLAAVQTMLTFDPATSREDVRPLLNAVRIRAALLVDRLGWENFDRWATDEWRFGVTLMREAAVRGQAAMKDGRLSAEDVLAIDKAFTTWVAGFTGNLRMCRKRGPDPQALSRLREVSRQHTKTVCDRNGWEVPPDEIPGLAPLSDAFPPA